MLGVSDSSLRLDIDKTQVLEESLLFLTKNEYLILKSLLNSSSLFIEKESIACILSPKSGGIGVSDAAISQAVKRLRTKLKSNNIKITIRTKRGFGYIIG
jgi:DNA-binding response OmpR family regulator